MEYTKTNNGNVFNVVLRGKFTFSDHKGFKELFDFFENKDMNRMEIDITNVEFVDSAALGLLLLARDEANKTSKTLQIKGPNGQVKKMFEISRFYELFDIVE